jgi:DNA invertase Pin-like site-specific DNA recombinase
MTTFVTIYSRFSESNTQHNCLRLMENNIYSYGRCSSKEQVFGDSKRRQEEKAKYWAQAHNKKIARFFFDAGVSAFHGANRKSEQFTALSSIIKNGDKLLFENLDRFGRDETLALLFDLKTLLDRGVTVILLDSSTELSASSFQEHFMTLALQGHLGYLENKKKAERIGQTWAQKKKAAANGKVLSKMCPAWLLADTERNKFTFNEPNKKAVLRIFDSFASGRPIRAIAKELNSEKVAPFGKGNQNKSGGWSSTHIRRLLGSRAVLGEYQPHSCRNKSKRQADGEPNPNYYPAIIKPGLFYEVEEMLKRNKSVGGVKTGTTNLFTGIAKCAHCGGSMILRLSPKAGKYHYSLLRCSNAQNHAGCEHKNTIQLKHVERAVLSILWSIIIPKMTAGHDREQTLKDKQAELRQNQKQIGRLTQAIADTDIAPEAVMGKIRELEQSQALIKSEVAKLESLAGVNPFLDWKQCEPTVENRLRLQNILRGEIESLKIDARGHKALLILKVGDEFELEWDYQRANHYKQNPADAGFTIIDYSGDAQATPRFFTYADDMFVWNTGRSLPMNVLIAKLKEARPMAQRKAA